MCVIKTRNNRRFHRPRDGDAHGTGPRAPAKADKRGALSTSEDGVDVGKSCLWRRGASKWRGRITEAGNREGDGTGGDVALARSHGWVTRSGVPWPPLARIMDTFRPCVDDGMWDCSVPVPRVSRPKATLHPRVPPLLFYYPIKRGPITIFQDFTPTTVLPHHPPSFSDALGGSEPNLRCLLTCVV